MKLEEKSNNELKSLQLELQTLHNSKKLEALRILDEMDDIEAKYLKVIEILKLRTRNG